MLTMGGAAVGVNQVLSQCLPPRREVAPLKVGIVGTGARGRWLAKVAGFIPEIQITAVCDLLETNAKACQEAVGKPIKIYSDYKKLLEDRDVQAILIAVPLFLHYEVAKAGLMAGKHVYCEKTLTHTITEAVTLRKLATSSNHILQVGYQHRFNPVYQEIKFLIDQGYCGKILAVECTWNRNGNWRRDLPAGVAFKGNSIYPSLEHLINWRMYKRYSAGLTGELCSHQIDMLHWLLGGHPEYFIGVGSIDYWKDGRETYDNVHFTAVYPDGLKASFTSLTFNALQGYSLKILGDKGSIEVNGDDGHRAKIYSEQVEENKAVDSITEATKLAWENREGIPVRVKNPATDDMLPTENALRHFAECVAAGKKPDSNIDTAIISSIAVCLANEAIEQRRVVYWREAEN